MENSTAYLIKAKSLAYVNTIFVSDNLERNSCNYRDDPWDSELHFSFVGLWASLCFIISLWLERCQSACSLQYYTVYYLHYCVNFTVCTAFYSLHSTLYSLHSAVYNLYSKVCIIQWTFYNLQYTFYSVHYKYTVRIVQHAFYSVHSTLCIL